MTTNDRADLTLAELQERVRNFSRSRDWLRFHNPRYLAEAIAIEAGELLECFQWKTDEACLSINMGLKERQAVESEVADIVIYALNLLNSLSADAAEVIQSKLVENAGRFPASDGR